MKTLGEYLLAVIVILLMIPVFLVAMLFAMFEAGHYLKIRSM